jgi:hypothetical protein
MAATRSSLPRKSKARLRRQRTQHLDIRFGEVAEMVGAERSAASARLARPSGAIAAEVAEIAGAGEVEVSDGWIWHRR